MSVLAFLRRATESQTSGIRAIHQILYIINVALNFFMVESRFPMVTMISDNDICIGKQAFAKLKGLLLI